MRSKPHKEKMPELRIEVVGAKMNQPDAWIEARAYLADCLVDLLRKEQTVSAAGEKREP
jgi:hypothetical protein